MAKSEIIETIEVGETSKVDQKHRNDDHVVITIKKMLKRLPPVHGGPDYNQSIYQVPKESREMNEKAYAPQFISIGPFHHGTQMDLIANERYKLQGFSNFLRRIDNNKIEPVKMVVDKFSLWVKEEAQSFYATPMNTKEEEFVIMMLVDACFIVEFFMLVDDALHGDNKFSQIQDNIDFSFYQEVHHKIVVDLIKLENQVPFVLLQNLFEMIPTKDHDADFLRITYMVLKIFGLVRKYEIHDFNKEPKHLVDFLSLYFVPLVFYDMKNKEDRKLLHFFWPPCLRYGKMQETRLEQLWRISPTITELFKAGVTIKVAKNKKSLMKISFKNGVLEIPRLVIDSVFEVLIRNLIVFEQFHTRNKNMYATDYASFLNNLIRTEKDVDILVDAGVIINHSDKQVSEFFNNICRFASIPVSFHFYGISKDLHLHCSRKWNHDKALLKRNYFNTPWAIISLSAATFLLILTLLQTIFSAISAFPS